MALKTIQNEKLHVGDRVRWRPGKKPRAFGDNERGTVVTPQRRVSGETIYVEWDNQGTVPVSMKAVERAV